MYIHDNQRLGALYVRIGSGRDDHHIGRPDGNRGEWAECFEVSSGSWALHAGRVEALWTSPAECRRLELRRNGPELRGL